MLHGPVFERRRQTQIGLILNLEQKSRLLAPMHGLAALQFGGKCRPQPSAALSQARGPAVAFARWRFAATAVQDFPGPAKARAPRRGAPAAASDPHRPRAHRNPSARGEDPAETTARPPASRPRRTAISPSSEYSQDFSELSHPCGRNLGQRRIGRFQVAVQAAQTLNAKRSRAAVPPVAKIARRQRRPPGSGRVRAEPSRGSAGPADLGAARRAHDRAWRARQRIRGGFAAASPAAPRHRASADVCFTQGASTASA